MIASNPVPDFKKSLTGPDCVLYQSQRGGSERRWEEF
jgi:hypothetical protein